VVADAITDMFFPKNNPGYYALSEEAKGLIMGWVAGEWYESSEGEATFRIADEL